MPKFSKASQQKLETCDPRLQLLFNEVIKWRDCKVTDGYRGKEAQDEAYRTGASKLPFPKGRHNRNPSMAADVIPYPVDWRIRTTKQAARYYSFAGFVEGIWCSLLSSGKVSGTLVWGGDWDNDKDFEDQNWDDFPHFQIQD